MFAKSALKKLLEKCKSVLPEPRRLPYTNKMCPLVILADRAYPLKPYLMKPYVGEWSNLTEEQRLFNVRLATARRTVECAFGQVVSQFQCFQQSLDMDDSKLDVLVMVCFLLHNVMIDREDRSYRKICSDVQQSVNQKYELIDSLYELCRPMNSSSYPTSSNEVRDTLANFFRHVSNK